MDNAKKNTDKLVAQVKTLGKGLISQKLLDQLHESIMMIAKEAYKEGQDNKPTE